MVTALNTTTSKHHWVTAYKFILRNALSTTNCQGSSTAKQIPRPTFWFSRKNEMLNNKDCKFWIIKKLMDFWQNLAGIAPRHTSSVTCPNCCQSHQTCCAKRCVVNVWPLVVSAFCGQFRFAIVPSGHGSIFGHLCGWGAEYGAGPSGGHAGVSVRQFEMKQSTTFVESWWLGAKNLA